MNKHDTVQNSQTKLDEVLQPVNLAKGLPNAHYIDPDTFSKERDAVLYDSWSGIGFGKDIPEAGDVMPIEFLGMPLVAVRDGDGNINVFQNTCRHRGMILVQEKGKLRGTFRCPYHSWCYGLDGRLVTTPHVGGAGQNTHKDIKRDELGLLEIRTYVWRDVIFVNISGKADAFDTYASKAIERWTEFDQEIVHGGEESSFKLEVDTNWKLAVENYCESYHLPWIHPGLNSYSRLEDHYHIEEEGAFSGQGSWVYKQLKGDQGETFPDFKGLSEKWDEGAEYISFFPNVLFGVHRDHTYAILLEPKAIDKTVEHIEIYYTKEGATLDKYSSLRNKNAKLWKDIFIEDIFVVEGMQKGRHGKMFDGGKFSPAMDGPTHLFHHWIADKMVKHD